ncbi:Terpenoid cyclases/protein prenyltransferase alpha-alpha toroid [Penicillium cosmopolitanum]|uniref:Terpenoid cyclases/protein prenyltransferase alpha-alpha toroid n=1 Tax=Penicillium cosmopolitanum TaxID=1131564 RepID=A0A9W9W8I9_9EURO|nr:Terpenoid cyclases/protein prenyltransferase alpha-alpha toroid [Penicillium cosmopolitanum]KAJ5408341.1 Terpenoid cyclases/protein prenyltransferase alpha-alpha toroid [Penicillium cosmopolitanum]
MAQPKASASPEPILNTERHIKYYLRCLKTFLPSAYISNDSNRMLLAFLTLTGLDVLDALNSKTTPEERQTYIDWVYHCQVPSGGFRGFSGTDFGASNRTPENEAWDPANVPATFFALVNLLVLGDDLARVKRVECLRWLPKLQRGDGSFGEVLGPGEEIEGNSDLRYCCCAAGIRFILRGRSGMGVEEVEDIDVPRFISFIQACQSYDGGMAESPYREAHSGHTYCAVGSLEFLRRASVDTRPVQLLSPGSLQFETLVAWLASRQTNDLGEEDDEEEDEGEDDDEGSAETNNDAAAHQPTIDRDVGTLRLSTDEIFSLPKIASIPSETITCAGFNGRCNKVADTCYSFWNGATLAMLNRSSVIDDVRNRRYLLEKTQHLVGGFGKVPGDTPDLLHSCFGLVSLAFQGETGLARVDPALVTTERVVRHLESLPWHK